MRIYWNFTNALHYLRDESESTPGIITSLIADSTRSLKIRSNKFCNVVVTLRFIITGGLSGTLEVRMVEIMPWETKNTILTVLKWSYCYGCYTLTLSWKLMTYFGITLELVWLGDTMITMENTDKKPMADAASDAEKKNNIERKPAQNPTAAVAIIIKPPHTPNWTSKLLNWKLHGIFNYFRPHLLGTHVVYMITSEYNKPPINRLQVTVLEVEVADIFIGPPKGTLATAKRRYEKRRLMN